MGSALETYQRELASPKYNPLPSDVERTYLVRYRHGEKGLLPLLVNANLRYVVSIAFRFDPRGTALEPMDLIQEGCRGLMVAIDRYRLKYHVRLFTYATDRIEAFIRRALRRERIRRSDRGQETFEDRQEDTVLDGRDSTLFSLEGGFSPVEHEIRGSLREYLTPKEAFVVDQLLCSFDRERRTLDQVGTLLRCNGATVRAICKRSIVKLQQHKETFQALSS